MLLGEISAIASALNVVIAKLASCLRISANLVREFEHGDVLIYGRYVDDQNQWILPIPIQQDGNGNLSEFPGFDAGTGRLVSGAADASSRTIE